MGHWIALFWLLSSLIGDLVVGPNLIGSWLAWRDLVRGGASEPTVIAAWTHVRTDGGLLVMQSVFLIFGLAGFARPTTAGPQDWEAWLTTGAAMTLPWIISFVSDGARRDRQKGRRRILGEP